MKAILIIPGGRASPAPGTPCLSLFPLLDRPFVQRVIEALTGRGVTDVHVVLGHAAEAVEAALGDGRRWGCAIAYHLIGDPDRAERAVAAVARAAGGRVVIGRADCLPALPPGLPAAGPGVLFGRPGAWSGWAVADAADLADVGGGGPDAVARCLTDRGARWTPCGKTLELRSIADVPAAQRALLRGEVENALVAATEVRPGVWVARGARVAPTAVLDPPVFVGENTAVGPRARVGPYAVIGPGCMLDHDSAVRDATVCPDTYIGGGVALDGVIADGPVLIHPGGQTATTVDYCLLARVGITLPLAAVPGRLLATAGFLLAVPAVAAAAAWLWLTRPGPVFWRRAFARAPSSDGRRTIGAVYTLAPPGPREAEFGWVIPASVRGLVLELLPALGGVSLGSLRLVGLPPRGEQPQGRAGCLAALRSPPGLVTEAALCPPETADDALLVDAYQAHTSGAVANLKRLARFLVRAATAWGVATDTPAERPVAAHPVGK
jgi:hypothetical protein